MLLFWPLRGCLLCTLRLCCCSVLPWKSVRSVCCLADMRHRQSGVTWPVCCFVSIDSFTSHGLLGLCVAWLILLLFPTSLLTKILALLLLHLLRSYRCCIHEQIWTRTCYFMYTLHVVMHAVPNVIMLFYLFHRLTCTKLRGLGPDAIS